MLKSNFQSFPFNSLNSVEIKFVTKIGHAKLQSTFGNAPIIRAPKGPNEAIRVHWNETNKTKKKRQEQNENKIRICA